MKNRVGLDMAGSMLRKNQERIAKATRARVQKELAKPRMSKSVRDAQRLLAAARIAPDKL
jgi:hypothetical protein